MLRDDFSKLQPQSTENSHLEELKDGSLKSRLDQMLSRNLQLPAGLTKHGVLQRRMGNDQEGKYGLYYWSHSVPCVEKFPGADLLAKVAERLTLAPHVLGELSRHRDSQVRVAVAENEHTPPQALLMLAGDEHLDVRYSVAENYKCPVPVLIALTDDENPYIAFRAKRTLRRIRGGTVVDALFGAGIQNQALGGQEQMRM